MKCFNCPDQKCFTIYPKQNGSQYVAKKCHVCGWESKYVKIPESTAASLRVYDPNYGDYYES